MVSVLTLSTIYCQIQNLINILFRLEVFLLLIFLVMSGMLTQKNYCQLNRSGRKLLNIFAGGVSISSLKGKRVGNSPQRKWILKNRRQDVERVAGSKIFPNLHVFISIFGLEIEEKVHYYLFKKTNLSATKTNFKNRRQEVERVAEFEIVRNRHLFFSVFGRELEERLEEYIQRGYCFSAISYF